VFLALTMAPAECRNVCNKLFSAVLVVVLINVIILIWQNNMMSY